MRFENAEVEKKQSRFVEFEFDETALPPALEQQRRVLALAHGL